MTAIPRLSRKIGGKGLTVRELLAGRKYSSDYCQREGKWQKAVAGLQTLVDLACGKRYERSETSLQESPTLLMWYNQGLTRNGEEA